MSDFDERVIAEFRADGGRVQGFGGALVPLQTTGARSGASRTSPVMALQEGGSWLVVASAAGAPKDPAWAFNLRAHPDVAVESPIGALDVHAIELEDEERADAYARFVSRAPMFADYERKAAPRRMPIFRLEPRG